MINVIVAHATPSQQIEIPLQVEESCTVVLAIKRSGILSYFPEIKLPEAKLGIYSQPASLDASLQEGDRIEIYRPLTIDPKQARLLRAKKASACGSTQVSED